MKDEAKVLSPDEALKALTEGITKKKSKELKYHDNVVLTAEQKVQLKLADTVIKAYGEKFASMRDFFKSDQWADVINKIGANEDTVKYLLRNTATALGESARAVEQIKEIIRKYGK